MSQSVAVRAGRGADCLPYARSAAKGKHSTSLNKQISPCVVIEYIGHAVVRQLKRRTVNREDRGHHQTRSRVISLSNKDRRGPGFESTMLYYFEPNKNVITVYSSLRNVHLKKGNILPWFLPSGEFLGIRNVFHCSLVLPQFRTYTYLFDPSCHA